MVQGPRSGGKGAATFWDELVIKVCVWMKGFLWFFIFSGAALWLDETYCGFLEAEAVT
jgi:hypothetical protein